MGQIIIQALMGYTTVDAYAALNKHLAAMNLLRICFGLIVSTGDVKTHLVAASFSFPEHFL